MTLPPPFAASLADIIAPEAWTAPGPYMAESHDALFDGSCEVWTVDWATIALEVGSLRMAVDFDEDVAKVCRALLAAMGAFNEAYG